MRVYSTDSGSTPTKRATGKRNLVSPDVCKNICSLRYSSYEGNWASDAFDGHGMYSDRRGSRYNGEWKQDKMHGKGVYVRSN